MHWQILQNDPEQLNTAHFQKCVQSGALLTLQFGLMHIDTGWDVSASTELETGHALHRQWHSSHLWNKQLLQKYQILYF